MGHWMAGGLGAQPHWAPVQGQSIPTGRNEGASGESGASRGVGAGRGVEDVRGHGCGRSVGGVRGHWGGRSVGAQGNSRGLGV